MDNHFYMTFHRTLLSSCNCTESRRLRTYVPSGIEEGFLIRDEDVDAVDVATVWGDAVGELRHDPDRVRALEHVDPTHVPGNFRRRRRGWRSRGIIAKGAAQRSQQQNLRSPLEEHLKSKTTSFFYFSNKSIGFSERALFNFSFFFSFFPHLFLLLWWEEERGSPSSSRPETGGEESDARFVRLFCRYF